MREKIKLVSSAGTGYFYTTDKNKKLSTEKLRMKKYDPKVRKHVEFVEEKLSYAPRRTPSRPLPKPPPRRGLSYFRPLRERIRSLRGGQAWPSTNCPRCLTPSMRW